MSYNFSVSSVKQSTAKEALESAFNLSKSAENNPPCVNVVPKVITAIEKLLKAGVFGTADKTFNVSISGHANPDHEKVSGWSNDGVYISISQV